MEMNRHYYASDFHLQAAEGFLLSCIRDGLAHSYDVMANVWLKPYPEVTGYLLSYFSDAADNIPDTIIAAADTLISLQHSVGGFHTFDNPYYLYTFDTEQMMYGMLSLYRETGSPKYLQCAVTCADFICAMQLPNGAMWPNFDLRYEAKAVNSGGSWGSGFSFIQAKNIEGLLFLFSATSEPKYQLAAEKLAEWAKANIDLSFTHPGAYCLEGLLAIGEEELVREKLVKYIIPRLKANGFLAYSEGLPYSYVSGSAQMAILLFRTGILEESRKILMWLRKVQMNHTSGGLFQYADAEGKLDHHVHTEINSWGTKYFAQLERLWL